MRAPCKTPSSPAATRRWPRSRSTHAGTWPATRSRTPKRSRPREHGYELTKGGIEFDGLLVSEDLRPLLAAALRPRQARG